MDGYYSVRFQKLGLLFSDTWLIISMQVSCTLVNDDDDLTSQRMQIVWILGCA